MFECYVYVIVRLLIMFEYNFDYLSFSIHFRSSPQPHWNKLPLSERLSSIGDRNNLLVHMTSMGSLVRNCILIEKIFYLLYISLLQTNLNIYTEINKYLNLVESTQICIVVKNFRLIWQQIIFLLAPNHSVKCNTPNFKCFSS